MLVEPTNVAQSAGVSSYAVGEWMDPEVVVGVGSAALSLVGAVTAGIMANRSARQAHELERQKHRETQREIAERILQQYRDPLLDAAHTLQGRLFNIMAQNFLGTYLNHPDPEERRYARDYTGASLP
jgi:hypothetical protein